MVTHSFSWNCLPYVEILLKVNFKKVGVLKWLIFQKHRINRNWTGAPDALPIILVNQPFYVVQESGDVHHSDSPPFILQSRWFTWLSPVRRKQTPLIYITYPLLPESVVLLRLKANLHGCWISWSLFNKQTKKKLICRNMTASSLKLMADVLRPPWQQNFIWVKRKKTHPLNEVLLWLLYLSKNEPWSYILVLHSSKKEWVCTTWT